MDVLFASFASLTDVSASVSVGSITTSPPSLIGAFSGVKIAVSGSTLDSITFSYKISGNLYGGSFPIDPTSGGTQLMWVDSDGHLHYYEQLT